MPNKEPLNVLIVEDEPLISLFIQEIVMGMGEKVIGISHSSDDAIEMLTLHKPNLIFMDINIHGPLDGISVIKKVPMPQEPTIFFVSAYSDPNTINEALSIKAYNYIIKPVRETDIQIAVTLARKEQMKKIEPLRQRIDYNHRLYYDLVTKELMMDDTPCVLSGVEKKLLELFMNNINRTLTIDEIKYAVWQEKTVSNSTLRDIVSILRKKLPDLKIKTNFGTGYILLK